MPDDVDMVMHGQVVPEDAYSIEVADRDRLVEMVQVLSSFGSLMSDPEFDRQSQSLSQDWL